MGSYISNRNVCAQTWNLFNDDRCTLPENWTRMAKFDSEIRAQRARTISPLLSSKLVVRLTIHGDKDRRLEVGPWSLDVVLRVDARKWAAARLAPRKYGED